MRLAHRQPLPFAITRSPGATSIRVVPAIAGLLIAVAFTGCSASPQQQVWSTKAELAHHAPTESAQLNFDPSVATPPASKTTAGDLRQPATSILLQAATSTNPLLRANAIEALQSAPEHLADVVRTDLGDENRGVRFAAAMTVGKLQLKDFTALVQPLLHDESKSVQAAAIFALRRCDRQVDPTPLAEMLVSQDAEVRGNAAYVLGELGDNSAVAMLRQATGRGMVRTTSARRKIIDLQIAEAMVKLGADQELEVIRAALFAPAEEGELVALACQMCGELNDSGALPNLVDLAMRTGRRQQSAEVRMAAAAAIAQIDSSKAPIEVPLGYVSSPQFELRAQAAHTLAQMTVSGLRQPRVLDGLAKLLNDSNAMVQVAAADGVLRTQKTELANGWGMP